MAKIESYSTATPTSTDLLLGTDVGSSNATKNFTVQSIADFAAVSGNAQTVSTLVLNGTDNTTTSVAIYGVNVIDTATVADRACKLPVAVTGQTVYFVNNSSMSIYVFPSAVGGSINGVVDGMAEIPNDGSTYTFICYENPLPGAWTYQLPATGQIVIPEFSIAHTTGVATNNYGVNSFGTVSSVGVDGFGNLTLGGDWASENDPTTLTKLKVYTNILQSDVPTGTITFALLNAYKTSASAATSGQRNTLSFKTTGYSGSFSAIGTLNSPAEVGDTATLFDIQGANPVLNEYTQLGTGGTFSRYYYQLAVFMPAAAATKTYKFKVFIEKY